MTPEVREAARKIMAAKCALPLLDPVPRAPVKPAEGPGLVAAARLLRHQIDLEEHVRELDAWRLEAMRRLVARKSSAPMDEAQLERILRAQNLSIPPRSQKSAQNY